MEYTSIRPGKVWKDTEGKLIQAHGFSVFYDAPKKTYYWYGENKEFTKKGGKIWHWGVRCYASRDFYNWEDKGLIIPPQPNDLSSPLHPTYCMDRPHILFCPKTKKYVAWLKIMAGGVAHDSQFMSVLQADHFFGPYEFVRKIYKPLQMNTGDFTLAEADGKAYIFFERPHFELICATLTEDYTAVSGEYSAHYTERKPPFTREAPTFFTRGGKKYLITSGTSGYYPNRSTVAVFDEIHGKWRDLGDPCIGDKTDTTFNSQISCVIKIPDKRDLYVALADRWLPNPLVPKMSKMIVKGMEKHFADYVPDKSPQSAVPLPQKETVHKENTYKSRYVWLPVEWEGEKPVIRWKEEWRLEEYK